MNMVKISKTVAKSLKNTSSIGNALRNGINASQTNGTTRKLAHFNEQLYEIV